MESGKKAFREYQEKFAERAAQLVKEGNREGARVMLMAADWTLDMEAKMIEAEIVRGVRAAVQRLQNDRQRYVITETELKGRPYRELAEELGISIETVRGDHNKAFKALRRDWELIALKKAHCIDPMAYYRYKGARRFQTDWTSTTESAALWGVYGGELYRDA